MMHMVTNNKDENGIQLFIHYYITEPHPTNPQSRHIIQGRDVWEGLAKQDLLRCKGDVLVTIDLTWMARNMWLRPLGLFLTTTIALLL